MAAGKSSHPGPHGVLRAYPRLEPSQKAEEGVTFTFPEPQFP